MKLLEKTKMRLEKRKKRINAKLKTSKIQHQVRIFRTNKHFYAQIYDVKTRKFLTGVATSKKGFSKTKNSNSKVLCEKLAKELGVKLKEKGISEIIFNRAGFKYHGKIKSFAETLRAEGIKF